jgi:hypothetical protein
VDTTKIVLAYVPNRQTPTRARMALEAYVFSIFTGARCRLTAAVVARRSLHFINHTQFAIAQ